MSAENIRVPSDAALKHAAKISITDDKPIMLDYWQDSMVNQVFLLV